MTRSELLQSVPGSRHHDPERALRLGLFNPPPERDGSGRYVYTKRHVRQLADLVSATTRREPGR